MLITHFLPNAEKEFDTTIFFPTFKLMNSIHLEQKIGLEPTSTAWQAVALTLALHLHYFNLYFSNKVQVEVIETSSSDWKSDALAIVLYLR
jgi:hypothetical protein